MESLNENVNTSKQRHGCVTAWLVVMIIIHSLAAIIYLFASEFIMNNLPNVSKTMIVLLGVFSVANVIFAVMLFQWKKIGFWGFIGTSIVALIINLSVNISIGQVLGGLVGIAILYGILQIKKNNVTTWDNLE